MLPGLGGPLGLSRHAPLGILVAFGGVFGVSGKQTAMDLLVKEGLEPRFSFA